MVFEEQKQVVSISLVYTMFYIVSSSSEQWVQCFVFGFFLYLSMCLCVSMCVCVCVFVQEGFSPRLADEVNRI